MWEWLDETLRNFEKCFSRKAAFSWFVIIIIGLMMRSDHLGITSIVRELGIDPKLYETMIHFFRADSWGINKITEKWIQIVKSSNLLYHENQMPILVGDGVKQGKEGKKMAGVKKQHQESENSLKPEYIFGHLFGVVGVLIGNTNKTFCVPLSATVQDGVNVIRKWSHPYYKERSHVEQMICDACNAASNLGHSILLLDRYFLSVPALLEQKACENQFGETLLSIVTKAKKSAVAFTKPEKKSGKGRPRIKGDKVKLTELFKNESNFITTTVFMYGKLETVKYLSTDLLWGNNLYQELRFVLVKYGETESILACTDLAFSPEKIIRLYCYRFKIEVTFRSLKQLIAGFSYHFWSTAMPKLNKYLRKGESHPIEMVQDKNDRELIVSNLKAVEGYVLFSCIAIGLLQIIAVRFSAEINTSNFRWLRTKSNKIPSEATVVDFMRKTIYLMFQKMPSLCIMQIINSKKSNTLQSADSHIA